MADTICQDRIEQIYCVDGTFGQDLRVLHSDHFGSQIKLSPDCLARVISKRKFLR